MYDIPEISYDIPSLRAKTILEEAIKRLICEEITHSRDQRFHRAGYVRMVCLNNNIKGTSQLKRLIETGEFGKLKEVGPKTIASAERILRVAQEIKRFQIDIQRISQLEDPKE